MADLNQGPVIRATDANGYQTGGYTINPNYSGAPVAPINPQTGATATGSTLQQLSIGLANGSIKDQAGVNQLYGNAQYGSAVPPATPETSRYTAAGGGSSYAAPSYAAPAPAPAMKSAAVQTGSASAPQGDTSGAGSTASGVGGGGDYTSRYETPEEKQMRMYLENPTPPKTEAQILSEKTSQAQDQINNINNVFNSQLLDQSRLNDQRSAETNAQSVLNGLTGSTEAGQRAFQTTGLNNSDNAKIQNQKALALSTLYSQIKNDAATEARQQAQDYRTNAKDALASIQGRRDANAAKAEKSVIALAKLNTTFDGLKKTDSATFNHLADLAGGEQALKELFMYNTPKETILYQGVQSGHYLIVKQMPDGTIKKEDVDLQLPKNYDGVQDLGDQIMFYDKSNPMDAIYKAKAPDQLKQLQIQKAQLDLEKGYQDLEKGKLDIKKLSTAAAGGMGQPSAYTAERTQRTINSVDALTKQIKEKGGVGWGSIWSWIPASDAKNLSANITTLKANIAFNELNQMREASKTGGALGQVSNIEEAMLSNALGAISDQGQSKEQFLINLQAIKDSINRWNDAVQKNGGLPNSQNTDTTNTTDNTDYGAQYPQGTDGAAYGYAGYHSDGTQWVTND